jgi:uncharacterized LabA/DUF88 family protein
MNIKIRQSEIRPLLLFCYTNGKREYAVHEPGQGDIGIFVDYDNLTHAHKNAGILDVITKALVQIPIDTSSARIKCEIRVYGGWYEQSEMTRLAQDVTIELQRDFPSIVKVPSANGRLISIQSSAELAVSLMEEPSRHLFHTFRKKGLPTNIKFEESLKSECRDTDCLLPMLKKILKTGRCPKHGCTVSRGPIVYRSEQKLVDTMLSCDLVHASKSKFATILLISGDDDFIPPIRTVLLHGIPAIRFHPKPNHPQVSFPAGGARFLELEL